MSVEAIFFFLEGKKRSKLFQVIVVVSIHNENDVNNVGMFR